MLKPVERTEAGKVFNQLAVLAREPPQFMPPSQGGPHVTWAHLPEGQQGHPRDAHYRLDEEGGAALEREHSE